MMVHRALPWACCVLAILLALGGAPAARADSGTMGRITGVICTDAGRPLDFANIILLGTTMGAMSRNGGRFEVDNVPPGRYQIKAAFVGYDSQTTTVDVWAGRTSMVSFCGAGGAESPGLVLPPPSCGELRRVDSKGAVLGQLALRRTSVRATIAAAATHVVVEQTFENSSPRPIEAVYVFPLPHRAAIDDMQIRIGPRVVRAEIRRRQEAAQLYAVARQEGRVAALLEQERPNIFTQHVANIMPGHDVVVRLRYFEELPWADGYELVIPTVVGPRYIPGAPVPGGNLPAAAPAPRTDVGAGWSPNTDRVPDAARITPPVLAPGVDGEHDLDIAVELDAGVPIENLECVNHAVDVSRNGTSQAHVQLRPTDRIPNKDFVLRWRVAADRLRFGVLAHRDAGSDLGTFTLLMRPPGRSKSPALPPLDLVLVLDVSGSMQGAPLEAEKGVVRWLLQRLRWKDHLSIIEFSDRPRLHLPPAQPCTAAHVEAALRHVEGLHAGGGTEMLAAIRMALALGADRERNRILCMFTDGYVGNESEILREVEAQQGTRLFVIGIGTSPNRHLVDGLAEAGRATHGYVSLDEDPRLAVDRLMEQIESPVLHDVAIDWKGLHVQDVQPDPLPPLFAGMPLQITGRYQRAGKAEVVIRGRRGEEHFEQRLQVELPARAPQHEELRLLWARQRIHALERRSRGGDREAAREIETLGLDHALMTSFTSFVATDNQVVNPDGAPALVPQPVEMPQGVRYEGIFGRGGLRRGVSGVTGTITVSGEARRVDVKSSEIAYAPTSKQVLPLEEVQEAVARDSGVVVQGAGPHVRGGRSAEEPVRITPAPGPAGDPAAGVPTIRIELESPRLRRGEPVRLHVVIENTTGRSIEVPTELRFAHGSIAVSVSFGDIPLPAPERLGAPPVRTTTLQPGESRAYFVALDDVDGYAFSMRGTYQIRCLRLGPWRIAAGEQERTLVVD